MRTTRLTLYKLLLTLAICASAQAGEPASLLLREPLDAGKLVMPQIRFPKGSGGATVPTGTADDRVKLTAGTWYVIDFDEELLVDQISKDDLGSVTITQKTGPLHLPASSAPGRDADADDPDFCTIKGKYVYLVKAKTDGAVILEVFQTQRKDAEGKVLPFTRENIVRKTVDVLGGSGPRPPPKPVDPDTILPVDVKSFRVIFSYESGAAMTAAQSGVMYAKSVEDYLKAHTTPENGLAGFRRYDKDTNASNDQPIMAALWSQVKPKITVVPCMIIEVNGNATILPYPKDPADCLATLKKYRGDK